MARASTGPRRVDKMHFQSGGTHEVRVVMGWEMGDYVTCDEGVCSHGVRRVMG